MTPSSRFSNMSFWKRKRSPGFTLNQVIIGLVLMSILALMVIPVVLNNSGRHKLLNQTKGAAVELAHGLVLRARTATGATGYSQATPNSIATQMNYTRIATSGLKVQLRGPDLVNCTYVSSPAGQVCEIACSAQFQCAVLQDGGLLMYDNNARFIASGRGLTNEHYLRFIYDPDGSDDIQSGVVLYLFYGGRVTTEPWGRKDTAIAINDGLPRDNAAGTDGDLVVNDPEYVWGWYNECDPEYDTAAGQCF